MKLALVFLSVAFAGAAALNCDVKQQFCTMAFECGSDGKWYHNGCAMNEAICRSNGKIRRDPNACSGTPIGKREASGCPMICPAIYSPVCGSNGKTYSNQCALKVANCMSTRKAGKPITMSFKGDCEGNWIGKRESAEDCPMMCPFNYLPVCGSDGKTYGNKCTLNSANCMSTRRAGKAITMMSFGECDKNSVGKRQNKGCPEMCIEIWSPLCASDGKTYGNTCKMQRAACLNNQKLSVVSRGTCESATTPAPKCSDFCFTLWSPVCGTDGKTYSNTCKMESAACRSGTKITTAHRGECQQPTTPAPKKDNCPDYCADVYDPVCGSDGRVYSNSCHLRIVACKTSKNLSEVRCAN